MAVAGRGAARRGARAAAGVACLALLLWAWRGGGAGGERAELASRREFPRRAPADVAHRLADFSTLPHALGATPGSWRVEEERGNFSSWRYVVEWECGAGCAGRARVSAHAPAPGGPPAPHRVALLVRTCTRAALPWSDACDEMEVAAEVESDGADGAVLRERARATCGAGAGAGAGAGECGARLRAQRAHHHDILAGSI